MKASSKAGYGSGWHKESLRHSRAKRLGKAGGNYADRLLAGAKVESEHAQTIAKIKKNPSITPLQAEKLISADHLREDPLYYNKLATIERKMSRQDKIDFLMKSGLHRREQLESLSDVELDDFTRAGIHATIPVQIIEVHPARDASEAQQDKLIIDSAREHDLNPHQLSVFAFFMKHRLKGEQDPNYTSEWAGRFKQGTAWNHADYKARKILKQADPKKYGAFKKDDSEYMEIDTARKKGYKATERFKSAEAYEDAVATAQYKGKYRGYTSFMDGSVIAYYK
jgi:hypothetical protein